MIVDQLASTFLRRLASTFAGAPKVNYFPHLSKRKGARVSQDRGQAVSHHGGDISASQFRCSLSEPDYVPGRQRYDSPAGAFGKSVPSGIPKVVAAEGANPFTTPEFDPVRHSVADPEYLSRVQPQTSRKL